MTRILKQWFIQADQRLSVQAFRYALVGGVAAAADVATFGVIANIAHVHYAAAKTASLGVGLLVNYFLSRRWVFNCQATTFRHSFLPFAVIGLIGLLWSIGILLVLIDGGVLARLSPQMTANNIRTAANLLAIFLVFAWNFVMRKRFVFAQTRQP